MTDELFYKELISKAILQVKDNKLKILDSIDLTMYGAKAWAFTLQEVGSLKGKEFLYQVGYDSGLAAATEYKAFIDMKKKFVTDKLTDITNIVMLLGFGIIKFETVGDKTTVTIVENHIVKYGLELCHNDSMVCDFYRGVYASFLNVFFSKTEPLKEIACIRNGAKNCVFST